MGWRAIPASMVIAMVAAFVHAAARIVVMASVSDADGAFTARVMLVAEGIGFATQVLWIAGLAELASRFVGRAARGVHLALGGVAIAFALDVLLGLVQFAKEPWTHQTLYTVYQYAAPLAWLGLPVSLTLALPAERRVVGIVAIVVVFVSWPLPMLREPLLGWIGEAIKTKLVVSATLQCLRYAALFALAAAVASGTTSPDPARASHGYRLAAKALWLRVMVAIFVVLVTLMMVGSRGGGSAGFFKLALMSQGLFGVIALVLFGLGALRAVRANVAGLGTYTLAVGGGAVLWAAGVMLAQLPMLYRMLYGEADGMWGRDMRDFAEVLALAMPLVVILGVGLLATALSGFAARRGDEALRAQAQGKGIGYVVLMLVAIAIQTWMLPKSTSLGNFAALSLLSAGASLGATVMIAKLFGRGADALAAEPGLPTASVVPPSDGA